MSSLRRCGVGVIVDSRKDFTQTLFAFEGPTFRSACQLSCSQFNAKSAVEDNFDQPDGFSFVKNLVCSP